MEKKYDELDDYLSSLNANSCHFCHVDPMFKTSKVDNRIFYIVQCPRCMARAYSPMGYKEAVEYWNGTFGSVIK